METSSPLAAMHRPAAAFAQARAFRPNHVGLSPGKPRTGGGFNIRDQFRSRPDYFSVKPVHGSSPTGSLAADLCQNFRIGDDTSPPCPTPRRALFTANNLAAAAEDRGYLSTPPPASSPMQLDDMMDISPMPQKVACVMQVEIHSPTPLGTPDAMDIVESPVTVEPAMEVPKPTAVDRRKVALRRPSLSRAKGYSTGGMPGRLYSDNSLANFRFGGESRLAPSSTSSSLSLDECFDGSPSQDPRPQTANSPSALAPAAMRARQPFSSLSSATGVRNGSPITSHARRPSNPFVRPRKQYRRSLSMFESPVDVIKPKKEDAAPVCNLAAVLDVEEHQPVLPHFFPEKDDDRIPRINRETFLEILDGKFNHHYTHKLVIDCRFEYEYEGGHIDCAINYNDKDLLSRHLFATPMEGRTLLVFHCEYSAHRAPLMARHIRSEDRMANAACYPQLTYPEVYILEGGYSGFFTEHPVRCYPQAYVAMAAEEHQFTCEREMGRLKQNRKGLNRAKTFAFGQQDHSDNDSPSTQGRMLPHDSPLMMVGGSPILGSDRCHARRMASY